MIYVVDLSDINRNWIWKLFIRIKSVQIRIYSGRKISNYPHKALIQFDKYLVLLGRNYENEIATNSLTLPILLTVLISQFFYDFVRSFQEKISPLLKDAELIWRLISLGILYIFVILVAYGVGISLIKNTKSLEAQRFIKDYREIIEKMIINKSK